MNLTTTFPMYDSSTTEESGSLVKSNSSPLSTQHYCLGEPNERTNDSYSETGYSYAAVVIISILVSIFCIYVFVSNVAVIALICYDRAISGQNQNQYLISLAVADALLAVFIIPFSLYIELTGKWPFGSAYCNIYLSADVLLCTASIWSICAIGLDRYWSVKMPMNNRKKRTKKVIRIIILLVWGLSVTTSVPPFIFGFKLIPTGDGDACYINNATWYILFSCTLSFFLPAFIIAPVYTKIYLIGLRHSRPYNTRNIVQTNSSRHDEDHDNYHRDHFEMHKLTPKYRRTSSCKIKLDEENTVQSKFSEHINNGHSSAKQGNDGGLNNENDGGCKYLFPTLTGQREIGEVDLNTEEELISMTRQPKPKRLLSTTSTHSILSISSIKYHFRRGHKRRLRSSVVASAVTKRERRFTLIIFAVTGGFLICWYPFFQTYVIYALSGKKFCISKTFFKSVFWLGYMNSGFNPAIYTIFNKDFRRGFRKLFHKALSYVTCQSQKF